MKVLILHQHFNTPQKGGAIRSYYLAKALVDRGIKTSVITGHSEANEKIENVEGIEVHYLPIAYNNRFGFYRRSLSFIKYIVQSVKVAKQYSDADVCYAMSVPLTIGVAAWWIKQRYKIPYVFEVGDLWPDAPIQMGFVKNFLLKRVLQQLERSIYKHAKSIVALSPMIRDAIEKKAPGKTIHLIPNMADIAYYKPSLKQTMLVEKFSVQNKFVVSYIGALGIANGLDYYLECASASQKANLPIHFILCGEGAMLEHLQSTSKQLRLENFTIIPFQNRDGVNQVMNVTDATFVCYKPIAILETGSPNKYFDGLAAGKLIIVNFGGWIKDDIEKNSCGIFVDPLHPEDFVNKITPYVKDKNMLDNSRQASRALAEKTYSKELLGEKFVKVFEEFV